MGIPKDSSKNCLYLKTSRLRLPFTSLTEEYRATKARNLVTFQHSSDPCIREAKIKVDGGKKSNKQMEIEDAKSRLRIQEKLKFQILEEKDWVQGLQSFTANALLNQRGI